MSHCFGPFEINPLTNEIFLRLRKHQNIIITPPRLSDVPFIVSPLNDDRVHIWLIGPPYPYYPEHAQQFIEKIKPECDQGLQELTSGNGAEDSVILTHSPVRFLREVQEDGSDIFLGDIEITRCAEVEALLENPKHDSTANLALPAGHPEIVWTIGNYLAPSYHGRGIMTDAVDTIINDIARPYLGTQHVVVTTFFGNEGSIKVFLKNRFNLARQLVDRVEVKGKLQSQNVFIRHL